MAKPVSIPDGSLPVFAIEGTVTLADTDGVLLDAPLPAGAVPLFALVAFENDTDLGGVIDVGTADDPRAFAGGIATGTGRAHGYLVDTAPRIGLSVGPAPLPVVARYRPGSLGPSTVGGPFFVTVAYALP